MTKHIPNLITLTNAFFGVLALVSLWEGKLGFVLICVGICFLADYLDGFVARLLDARSDLGLQLDSLADAVSFGVLPGCILYYLCRESLGEMGMDWWHLGVLVFVPAAVFRLARFNLDTEQSYSFKGLPTPGASLVVFCLLWAWIREDGWMLWLENRPILFVWIAGLLSVLMNVSWSLMSMKWRHFKWKGNQGRYVVIVLFVVLMGIFQSLGILIAMGAFVVLSLLASAGVLPWKDNF